MAYNSQEIQDEVFSFSLTNDAPTLVHSPGSFAAPTHDTLVEDDFLIESPGFGAMAGDDEELFDVDFELSALPVSHKDFSSESETGYTMQDEFANAAQDNYRLWLASV
ncbi:LADA_0B06436g1_1 [Lachancea dasiensis]|uniref:LADA_0B06436g1_1 n=1 Tax=Lachancea dasiensis TaxID=1072105 RepID=A0A1G4ITU1_9SACH|nr:LADA_0B06436g1_1 [Lachancea dasiensis]